MEYIGTVDGAQCATYDVGFLVQRTLNHLYIEFGLCDNIKWLISNLMALSIGPI